GCWGEASRRSELRSMTFSIPMMKADRLAGVNVPSAWVLRRGRAMFTQIVSGGQTGVDRAALDVARELGMPCGGWCPRGRRAEDGPIPPHYPLQETPRADYEQRTRWNARDTGGTLVLTRGRPEGGTALAIAMARRLGKPCLVVDLDEPPPLEVVRSWAKNEGVAVVNVAGPRESTCPGIQKQAAWLLHDL